VNHSHQGCHLPAQRAVGRLQHRPGPGDRSSGSACYPPGGTDERRVISCQLLGRVSTHTVSSIPLCPHSASYEGKEKRWRQGRAWLAEPTRFVYRDEEPTPLLGAASHHPLRPGAYLASESAGAAGGGAMAPCTRFALPWPSGDVAWSKRFHQPRAPRTLHVKWGGGEGPNRLVQGPDLNCCSSTASFSSHHSIASASTSRPSSPAKWPC
jgi:hypothetical protein